VHLFNDTVANNIAYARTEEYSREQIEEAARMAYAMDFINKMDNGLDTIIGENGVCSPAASVSVLPLPARCCVTARS
jgi:subfamily B ATP-binding cassette protein MsbA